MENQTYLPISPRFASYFDSNENVIYSSNGNLLEKFEKNDNTLVFLEALKVLESGITIDKICKHPKGLIVTGDRRIVLFSIIEKKAIAKGKHFDHIIAVKTLNDETIAVLTARKKLNILKILEDGSFVDGKSFELNDECTIFTGILHGDSVEELEVFAGGILGSIHRHKPFEGAKVLSSYTGHEGMIFAMNICGNKLYTIGDDRSLRVYDIYSANELHVSYGHESRIRSLTVSSDERIFSAGDTICVWKWIDSSLKLVEKHEVGIGKIVHLNVIDQLLLASSMNGAMVAVQITAKRCQQFQIPALENLVVRAFIKTKEEDYFFVDDQKQLYFVSKNTVIETFIENKSIRFDSLRISNSGKYVAAASDNKVFLIEVATKKYCTISVEDVLGGEVFIEDQLFVIAKDGNGVVLSMKNNVFIKKAVYLSRGGLVKCGLAVDDLFIFGTAKGYIVAFHKNHLSNEEFSFKVSFKGEQVMDITVINSQLFVLTRDGKCSIYQKENNLYEVVDVFTTAEKPTAFLSIGDEHYIWGFRGAEFVFCPLRSPHPLAVYECGGGHRISDVYPVFDDKKNFIGIRYEHIVRGEFKIVEIDISHIQNVVGPYHQSNIYGIAMVNEGRSIVTAGIDTEIVLCSIDDGGRFCPKWRSTAHLSSIHSLDSVKLRNETEIVATCGGTSEIRLWKL
uniref:tRNA (34-2'-O)-methyltransferase regulator WDR6 n=1 Tax=Panagrolaimus superbus TaxID=310955 RepID=A0A914Y0K3_9BILA